MSYNRFLEPTSRRAGFVEHRSVRGQDRGQWSHAHATAERTLIVLIENGGVDLGIPDLVNQVVAAVPGASSVITDSMRGQLVTMLRTWLKDTTDNLIESAELSLNRYTAARPGLYNDVVVLRDSTSTFGELRTALVTASRAGKVIDLVILTHGGRGLFVSAAGSIDAAQIRSLREANGGPLNLRSVYMMNCVGSSLNQAWLDVGARTSAGTHENNYLPEPTTYFFWSAWKDGQTFETAVTSAYRRTIDTMNTAIRAALIAVVPLAGAALAALVDVSSLDFVLASRPEVVGAGSLTISSDALPAAPGGLSSGNSLVTTVVPMSRASLSRLMSTSTMVSASGKEFITRWEQAWLGDSAEALADLPRRITAVEGFLSEHVTRPLGPNQVDALASFALGIGAPAFARSTVLRLVTAGELASVPAEMRLWTKVNRNGLVVEHPGLGERRRAEADLFAAGVAGMSVPASREVRQYSYQQNPLLAIGAAEAIQIGLGAAAIVQTQVNASAGTLAVFYDKQQRLLTPDARLAMPGSARAFRTYTRDLFRFPQLQVGLAEAVVTMTWDGNDYGEISTPIVSRDFSRSSGWSSSSGNFTATAVNRIPTGSDPRTWPLWYHYEGFFDPAGNGQWEFKGDFEINAFGGIAFHNHEVKSRSLIDAAITVYPENWKGQDVAVAVPAIPAEQEAFIRAHVPV